MESTRQTSDLVRALCHALRQEGICYCHWKSNDAIARSASGENDLDLLVSRSHMNRFTEILARLGFKPARAPLDKQMPGVLDYFGYDPGVQRWIHVHAHYQLIVGHDLSKNLRLPIEKAYLASATDGELFRVPAPEFEFIVFVIRMALKHLMWDVILGGEGALKPAERRELAYLQSRVDRQQVDTLLMAHLPAITPSLFERCLQALQPDSPLWQRIQVGMRLQRALAANTRRPWPVDVGIKAWRRISLAIGRRLLHKKPRYRLESGGALIALVGGDGAGKSTAVDALYDWLSPYFDVRRVHMGKPRWSWPTIVLRSILKIGNLLRLYPAETTMRETLTQRSLISPGYPWLLRELCRARDRYMTYLQARNFAASGGLVLFDRFPHPRIESMDGPMTARFVQQLAESGGAWGLLVPTPNSRLVQRLIAREEQYYRQISDPDLLVVIRVDPTIAVQRKVTEDANLVHERSTEIWSVDWEEEGVFVLDGSKSKEEVLSELKAILWSEL
ncbi:MAG: hypothetical protein KatS3mg050_4067 [Litorilinea sp.]|nr:MAG: hypothetical protein KatS3mg050_4067 [Litorilinea sp.]